MLLTGVYIGITKWKMIWHYLISTSGFPGGSVVKNPLMQETQVQSPGWEDPLEKGMASHSSVFAWEIPWTEKPGRLQTMRLQKELDMTWWLNKWVHVLWLNNFTTRYIYPNLCTCALLDTYSRKFIEALFALAKNLKTIQISINSKWINKLWDTYPVKIFHCNENEWTAAGNTIVAQSQNCVWLFETPWTAAP